MYDATAASYANMMQTEITQPMYATVLGGLYERLQGVAGDLVDTSCGSGDMLAMYHHQYDLQRPIIGLDLAPQMVAMCRKQIGAYGHAKCGDMRSLTSIEAHSVAGIISFFAIHHLDAAGLKTALKEWHQALASGGQLVIAAWEGQGTIDYGGAADIVALRYQADEIVQLVKQAGFSNINWVVESVEGVLMDAVHLTASKGV